jgi:hypothetical protein
MYVKDRRHSRRLQVRLLFSVSICRKSNGNGSTKREHLLKGHTRDISARGLALNLPQVHLDGRHLAAEGLELQLILELPGDPVSIVIMPRRYERLGDAELGCSYLVGAQIIHMSDEDRERYLSFITQGLEGKS